MTQAHTVSLSPTQQAQASQETRRQQTVARLLGAQSFAAIPWQRLLREGALIQLRIGRCRFSTRLLLEDMGIHIEDPEVREKLARWTTLGEKRLLPQAYMAALSQVEGSARALLKKDAFQSELGFFVPLPAYDAWLRQTEALRERYFALRDEICAHHRDLVRQVLTDYEVIAADTYRRLRTIHPDLVREGEQLFVAAYCNRLASQIPTPARIRDSFHFRFFRVDGSHQLGTVPTEALTESAPARAAASETEQEARARARLAHDIRQDAQQRVNALLDDFLTSLVAQLRQLTYQAATDVLATIQRRGGAHFSGRSTMQLHHLLAQIRQLNFFGDTEMEQMMERVQAIVNLSPAERQRTLGSITQTLRAIATATRATLLDLEEEPRAPRADLGIATFPSEQLVHAARAELRLPPLDRSQIAGLTPDARSARAELARAGEDSLWQFVAQSEAQSEAAAATRLAPRLAEVSR